MRRKSNRPLISIFIFNAWMWHSALCICLSFTIYMLEGFGSFSILMRFFFLVMLLQMLKISTTNVILVSYTFFSCSLCDRTCSKLAFWYFLLFPAIRGLDMARDLMCLTMVPKEMAAPMILMYINILLSYVAHSQNTYIVITIHFYIYGYLLL